jgi:hypothetical protein
MAEEGLERVLFDQPKFREGIYVRDGRTVHPAVASFAQV